jgi:hypothetical protein
MQFVSCCRASAPGEDSQITRDKWNVKTFAPAHPMRYAQTYPADMPGISAPLFARLTSVLKMRESSGTWRFGWKLGATWQGRGRPGGRRCR